MNKALYKSLFSDYQQGYAAYIHIFNDPMPLIKEVSLTNSSIVKLKDSLIRSAQGQNVISLFSGKDSRAKLIQLQNSARISERDVCVVDCQLLAKHYIGETEKNLAHLVAQAETQNWLLYLSQAQYLLKAVQQSTGHQTKRNIVQNADLLERLSQYKGWVILDLDDPKILAEGHAKLDYVLFFNP
ncbi:hypothetical protein [Paraglaciecola aestuariivivens]